MKRIYFPPEMLALIICNMRESTWSLSGAQWWWLTPLRISTMERLVRLLSKFRSWWGGVYANSGESQDPLLSSYRCVSMLLIQSISCFMKYVYVRVRYRFVGAFANLRTDTINFVLSVCPSVCRSAMNISARTERIFMNFYTWAFFENVNRKFKCH
jgi:hypothetical protein